jgi:carbonic anhydrase
MSVFDELIAANARFAERRSPQLFPMPPARRLAILTCMDARLDTGRAFGIAEGDAHVIRNAGGRARDALRSLVISQRLLGTRAVAVVHHTDCGMLTFTNPVLHAKVKQDLGTDASGIDFLPFSSVEQSVQEDVALLESSPLLDPATVIRGFIYDVRTGLVSEVESQAALSGVR